MKGKNDAEAKLKKLQQTVTSFAPIASSIASSDISREGHGIFARWSRRCGFPHASQAEAEERDRKLAIERTNSNATDSTEASKLDTEKLIIDNNARPTI